MSKTIGRKICGLVAVIGVVMILMVVLNIAALGVLKGYSAEVKDNVVTLEKAVQSGDAGEKAEIDAVFEEWVRKNTVKINGTLIFDVILLVLAGVNIGIVVLVVFRTIAGPAKKAGKHIERIIGQVENNEGDLTERIDVKSRDEIGRLVGGFNNFIEQL